MLLVIDNYDSFTHNLVRYCQELDAKVSVYRNDAIGIDEIIELAPQQLLLSPGPCTPNEAGICLAAVQQLAGKLPILGVCLGHQTIAQALGAQVVRAYQAMHGKTSPCYHQQQGLFHGLPSPFTVARYHSLVVEESSLPTELLVDAYCLNSQGNKEIMALRHRHLPLFGVQFHPESIASEYGHQILRHFLQIKTSQNP